MEDSTTDVGGKRQRKNPSKRKPPAPAAKKTSAATGAAGKSAASKAIPAQPTARPEVVTPAEAAWPGAVTPAEPVRPAKQAKQMRSTKSAAQVEPAPVRAGPTRRTSATHRPAADAATKSRPATAVQATPVRAPLWARVLADPGYVPEHIALEAVRRLGPEAREWTARARARYPAASSDALARLATQEFTRTARWRGAVAGAAGFVGSLATTAILAQTQARLVLTIAAAYEVDPTSDERARELVRLLRVPRLTEPTRAALADTARLVAGQVLRAASARFMPFGAIAVSAVQGGRACADVAARAMRHYRAVGH